MNYRRLFIWVEGTEDERFFEEIIEPELREKYNFVETRRYATLKREKIDNFLNKLRNIDKERIIVVIKEIESWYLAGLGDMETEKFKIRAFSFTDTITKEQFDSLIPETFDSRIDFLLEILKVFSIETAKQKNRSFRYCIEKYNCGAF